MNLAHAYHAGAQHLDENRAYASEHISVLDRIGSAFVKRRLRTQSGQWFCLLPLAIAGYRLRAGLPTKNGRPWPEFNELTAQERDACSYVLQYLQGDIGVRADMGAARLWLLEPLLGLRDLDEKPLLVDRLPPLDQHWNPLARGWSNDRHNAVTCAVEVVDRIIERGPKPGAEPFEIHTTDKGFMNWISTHRDPKLWHQIASGGLNWDVTCNVEVIAWIVAQPECDPATAAGLFLWFGGQEIVGLPMSQARETAYPEFLIEVCQKAHELAARTSRLSLTDFNLKNNQTKWAEELDRLFQERAVDGEACVPSPSALFAAPYKGRRSTGWNVHSEIVIQRDV